MIEYFYEPWPGPVSCNHCGLPATVSYYDSDTNQTVVRHEAASAPGCRADGGSGLVWDGNVFTFSVVMGAEFDELYDAIDWGRHRVSRGLEEAVHLGYVLASGGHRKIGAVRNPDGALASVEKGDEEIVVSRR